MNSEHFTFKGVRRKIDTKIGSDRLHDIKDSLTTISKGNLLEAQRCFYKGGWHDSSGKNVQKQVNRIQELHQERLDEEK